MFVTRRAKGGIKTHLKTLVNKLPAYGITPIICGPKEDYEDFKEVDFLQLPLEDGIHMLKDYKNMLLLKDYIKRIRPDIVHSHGYKASLVVAMSKKLIDFPWITTIHNFQTLPKSKNIFEIFIKNVLNRANIIQPVSFSLKNELISLGVQEDICSVIYNGVSLSIFHHPLKSQSTLPKGKLIGCIGRLNHDKGIDNFIYSVKYLYDNYKQYFDSRKYNFLIIGDGPQKYELQRLAWKLGLASKIFFLGHREDIADILRKLKILCIPSKKEGLSITALEAMAALCPVIASKKGGLKEIIEHKKTGILVPSDDPQKMGEGIKSLVKSNKFRRMLTWQGYINVIKNYTDEEMVKKVVNEYNKIV